MSVELRPSVWVYAMLIDDCGSEVIRRYTFTGSDHADAAQKAAGYLKRQDVRRIETYDGEPRRWTVEGIATEIT